MKAVQENTKNILHNKHYINENKKSIQDNKEAIKELKQGYVPYAVFDSAVARYDKIVHRLIYALWGIVALLFISNAIWIYAWKQLDPTTTVINNKEGTTSYIGGDTND